MQLVHDFLRATAQRQPDDTALICGDRKLSFQEVDDLSDRVAAALVRLGVRRGDRVVLLMDNSSDLVISLFGVLKAGGVFSAVNPTTKAEKLAYVLNDSGARVLIARATLARQVTPAVAEAKSLETVVWDVDPTGNAPSGPTLEQFCTEKGSGSPDPGLVDNDLCTVIYTSGSTGEPKGVMLTHRNMVNTAWSISTYLENTSDDVVACVLPLSFDYGLYQVITGARVGFTVLLEKSFAYPADVLRRMTDHKVTGLPGVPTIFAMILDLEGVTLPSLRYMTNTAAVFPEPHIRRLGEAFPSAKIYSMYGLTECTRVSYLDPSRLHDKASSVGKSIPNCEAYVVDAKGRRVGPGVVGELVVRGANVMRGYWRKPEATRACLREGEIEGEVVLHTGDLFRMDEEGFLYFVGREDDVFKCKGEKISPSELEHVLHGMDGVAQAAVVGVDDPIDGKAVKAFVVPNEGRELEVAQVRKYCRAHLENYMVPRFVEIRKDLPKTASGKVSKRQLVTPGEKGEPCVA